MVSFIDVMESEKRWDDSVVFRGFKENKASPLHIKR